MTKIIAISIVAVLALSTPLFAHSGACGVGDKANDGVINRTCPVMGGDVDDNTPYTAVYRGKKVGLCCSGCVGEFKKDPKKYMRKLEKMEGKHSHGKGVMKMNVFDRIAKEAKVKDGIREISYEQFQALRSSGENYVLLDVLSAESYNNGHIEGAESFYVETINARTAEKRLSGDPKVVVYCGSFRCGASSDATKKLRDLGYDVLDYKGGLKEWEEKGNKLIN